MLLKGQRQAQAEEGALPSLALCLLPWQGLPLATRTRSPGVEQQALADSALPTLLATLTHQHASTASRSLHQTPLEVFSPGEPHSLPRPPWGTCGVSPPSCEMKAKDGKVAATGLPGVKGNDVGCAWELLAKPNTPALSPCCPNGYYCTNP